MELKDFLSETLKQIVSGVKEAQLYAKEEDAAINPPGFEPTTVLYNAAFSQLYPQTK